MKTRFEKFDGTFVIGISFSSYRNQQRQKVVSLIFDLGTFSLAFIFGGK